MTSVIKNATGFPAFLKNFRAVILSSDNVFASFVMGLWFPVFSRFAAGCGSLSGRLTLPAFSLSFRQDCYSIFTAGSTAIFVQC